MDRFDEQRIFSVRSDAQFERVAMDLFRFQAEHCAPYAEYLSRLGVKVCDVNTVDEIPMLPIGFFKSHDIYSSANPPQKVFTSSSTTGMIPSRHMMADLSLYERDFRECFRLFYGDESQYSIYGLLPSYLERQGSSLIYMVDDLIRHCGSGGFFLDEYERMLEQMSRDPKPKILLGVTYALLDLAEQFAPKLHDTIVMETGGMKGRRKELPKQELHKILCQAFGVECVHSEYGMAELTSQAYSMGKGIFQLAPWMKVLVRDVNDPFMRPAPGRRGALDIIDLGNIYSCAFLSTQDMGHLRADGSFVIEGRVSQSDIRGCNLLVQ